MRLWSVLAGFAVLGCAANPGPAPTATSTPGEASTVPPAVRSETSTSSSEPTPEFELAEPSCDAPAVTYHARGVVTVDGQDSPTRVDIIAKGPDASAKKACELALASQNFGGNLGQRIAQACSPTAIRPTPESTGWDVITPVVAEGMALRSRVGDPTDESIDLCTRVVWLHRSNYPTETGCREHIAMLRKQYENTEKLTRESATKFLTEQLAQVEAKEAEDCLQVSTIDAECDALSNEANKVNAVCKRTPSEACTRAKEASMLLEVCELRLKESAKRCEVDKALVASIEAELAAPPDEPATPQPYCREAGR